MYGMSACFGKFGASSPGEIVTVTHNSGIVFAPWGKKLRATAAVGFLAVAPIAKRSYVYFVLTKLCT